MRKLICTKCGTVWYTANESDCQMCNNCNEELIEAEDKEENVEIPEQSV